MKAATRSFLDRRAWFGLTWVLPQSILVEQVQVLKYLAFVPDAQH